MGQETESRVPREAVEAGVGALIDHMTEFSNGAVPELYVPKMLAAAYPLIREAVCQEIAEKLREAGKTRGGAYWTPLEPAAFVESYAATTEES